MRFRQELSRRFFAGMCLAFSALCVTIIPDPGLAENTNGIFTPAPEDSIPSGGFGDLIRNGEKIFTRTGEYAGRYTGNKLTCESCHLDRGRKAYSAPLWGAYVMYPRYRKKNHRVNTLAERIQGCFRFSMNGKAPPVDGRTIKSLIAYSFWMSRGAPVGVNLKGSRMVTLPKPAKTPDPIRGKKVYVARCALCHGLHGQGRISRGEIAFPPVWGDGSYNKGAGFYKVAKLAGFIKMNMPLSKGTSLPEQMAWDVAAYIESQPRPDKPLSK
ncbi:MAG: putative cytochrome C, class I [Leptospirillum sp. Group II 'C75']|jgi:thiosulfate dehydrogenase|uniref:c-type cytochrome n=1 Tax=Leptospirillum sp. Group II 'CF-1' TaxID=1660083 RepID=UPI0000F0C84A|nr:c-type cytochrome [Leptospirillum sp. Group II 'CF-1']AKS23814.1 cytochrome C [Leptospirillum sp. Group II 'CF-1']EAY57283.1 MAG: probable cytochrome C, class I [Leptospirillum rubarum]EIJ77372.1 MAG: putative cytochrome C, class I [Leptospirillum sp. Group II 'C75']